jgi:LysM repeat protein
MKNRIIFSLLFVFGTVFSMMARQDKYVKHTVAKGETITLIAQKYKVTPFDIYKLNPDSQNGIELNSVLLIPPSSAEPTVIPPKQTQPKANPNPITHLVQPKETLFSLSRQYGVSVEAIKEANGELLKEGLRIGQTIKIPSSGGNSTVAATTVAPQKEVVKDSSGSEQAKQTLKPVVKSEPKLESPKANAAYHIIEPKETKYGISKKYGMTIQELERLNPAILTDFPVGLKLVVSGNAPAVTSKPITSAEPIKDKPAVVNPSSGKKYLQEYVVKPKETIQSIAADFGITETELIQLNPELKKGIKLGMILRVPMGDKVNVPKKEQGNLMKNLIAIWW